MTYESLNCWTFGSHLNERPVDWRGVKNIFRCMISISYQLITVVL